MQILLIFFRYILHSIKD